MPSPSVAAIEEIASYFDKRSGVDALLLTGSWARGKGNVAFGADCDLTLLYNELFDLQVEIAAYEKWEEQHSLYFQCLKRLHHALEETLQALFIAVRRYPIAYDKWIEEQVSEILGQPELYTSFVQVVTLPQPDAQTLQEKAALLSSVLDSGLDSEQIMPL